jgi:hypothetical protein
MSVCLSSLWVGSACLHSQFEAAAESKQCSNLDANYFKPAAWHDAMSAALESSSAYATTAIAFDEKPRANPNLNTLMTHANANVRCVAAT